MGILDRFTQMISQSQEKPGHELTYRVVLGALLSLVSKADGKITEQEIETKKALLAKKGYTTPEEQQEILAASQRAIEERLDWQGFTREVNQEYEYSERVQLVRDLFSVAWADHELSHSEVETIRKISNLLWLEHKDFIKAKLETKPESLKE
ncbi:TerB family tellurite resistance protein [bacterium]|nr:TerB family tellurite resistance protein [bacterium]